MKNIESKIYIRHFRLSRTEVNGQNAELFFGLRRTKLFANLRIVGSEKSRYWTKLFQKLIVKFNLGDQTSKKRDVNGLLSMILE